MAAVLSLCFDAIGSHMNAFSFTVFGMKPLHMSDSVLLIKYPMHCLEEEEEAKSLALYMLIL